MRKYLLPFLLFLLEHSKVEGQQYQVFYPGGGTQQQNYQPSTPVVQNSFGSQHQGQQDQFPRSGEVLGNFFNGQIPQSPSQPSNINPFGSNRFQQEQVRGNQQLQNFPITSNYLSPPVSTSLPRQTHFFGNNYDFFRQFHNLPATPEPQTNQGFQPIRGSLYTTIPGTQTTVPSPSSTSTASPFTTSQFFTVDPNTNNNAFTFGQSSRGFQPSFATSTSSPASYPSSASPTYAVPTHRTAVSYPVNVVNNNIPQPNSIFNGYEDAAKAIGLSHNLRVITTESLRANPTVSLASVPVQASVSLEATPPSPPVISSESPRTTSTTSFTPLYIQTDEPSPSTTPTAVTMTTTTTTVAPRTQSTPPTIQYRSTVRSTGRSVASVNSVNVTSSSKDTIVSYRPRQPLFRHANRVVNVDNDIEDVPTRPPTTSRPTVAVTTHRPTTLRPYVETRRPSLGQGQSIGAHGRTVVLSQGRQLGHQTLQQSDPHGPYYYNNLQPGLLYTNTNGAYQSYYNGQQQQEQREPAQVGLEELIPEDIEFHIPQKMIPLLEQEDEELPRFPQRNQIQTSAVTERHQPVIIVTEATPKKVETSEVYRVGPKGRLLKKRRRVRPQGPQNSQKSIPSPTTSALSYAVRTTTQQQTNRVDPDTQKQYQRQRETTAAPPTTYRPRYNAVADDEEDEVPEKVTTYRSRFRYSPTTSTTSTTEFSVNSSTSQEAGTAAGGAQQKLIDSRLKSLERQIRFRNRKNTSK